MFAALCAALVAAVLSLGGASLVVAGQPEGKGGGNHADNGNGKAWGQGRGDAPAQQAPAAADNRAEPQGQSRGKAQGQSRGKAQGQSRGKAQGQSRGKAQGQATRPQAKHESAPARSNGGGSHSTATSGPGNSSQGCDGTHHSDTGHGANQGGPYDNTCDGSPSGNGNGNGKATGKPCAGCVGNADDKNPKGQMPNGSDHNKGYECDQNHGIGRTNPAHTGCKSSDTPEGGDQPEGGDKPKGGDKPEGDKPDTPEGDKPGGGDHGCPTAKLSTSLAKAAALALHVVAAKHPELSKLADLATVKANENCGKAPEHGSNDNNGNGHTPITICHATGSATNPYVEITIDENGLNGHADHQDGRDIIPAPAGGCPKGEQQPGGGECPKSDQMPAGDNGKDCGTKPDCPKSSEMPAESSGNDCDKPEHEKITICHATGSMTNPYVEITIDKHGLNGHDGHDGDIIPAPAGGCPKGEQAGGEQPGGGTPEQPQNPEQPQQPQNPEQPQQPEQQQAAAPDQTQAPATETPGQQGVLGVRTRGGSPEQAPATGEAPANEVLGANAEGGTAPAAASAPAAAQQVRAAGNEGGSLPFTGSDALLVLFLGCLTLLLGLGIQKLAKRTS